MPRLIRAGRHLAPTAALHRGPRDRVERWTCRRRADQAHAGNGWVKLVGDWIDRGVGDSAPTYDDTDVSRRGGGRPRGGRPGGRAHVQRGVRSRPDRGPASTRSSMGPACRSTSSRRWRRRGTALVPTMTMCRRSGRSRRRRSRSSLGTPTTCVACESGFPAVVRRGVRRGRADLRRHRRGRRVAHGRSAGEMLLLRASAGMSQRWTYLPRRRGGREGLAGAPRAGRGGLADVTVYPSYPRAISGAGGSEPHGCAAESSPQACTVR